MRRHMKYRDRSIMSTFALDARSLMESDAKERIDARIKTAVLSMSGLAAKKGRVIDPQSVEVAWRDVPHKQARAWRVSAMTLPRPDWRKPRLKFGWLNPTRGGG